MSTAEPVATGDVSCERKHRLGGGRPKPERDLAQIVYDRSLPCDSTMRKPTGGDGPQRQPNHHVRVDNKRHHFDVSVDHLSPPRREPGQDVPAEPG
jgi:hypothetical protein